jgi:hypothetical protein
MTIIDSWENGPVLKDLLLRREDALRLGKELIASAEYEGDVYDFKAPE